MKTCPVCKARCFDDMEICYGCMHRFEADGERGDFGDAPAPGPVVGPVPDRVGGRDRLPRDGRVPDPSGPEAPARGVDDAGAPQPEASGAHPGRTSRRDAPRVFGAVDGGFGGGGSDGFSPSLPDGGVEAPAAGVTGRIPLVAGKTHAAPFPAPAPTAAVVGQLATVSLGDGRRLVIGIEPE